MATAKASELPVLIINGADSPRSRIGRGLESVGGMTSETLQRISTAVGGVVKSPVVLMAKVGGFASPRAATLTAPPGSSLEERVNHLEIQTKSLEEKFSSMTAETELDLSTRSHKERPRIANSLLQEMETDMTLEKPVQMFEDRVNERMETFEKALSSIQSRLDHVEFSRRESVVGYENQESLPGEPQYYDAEQSDNFEALEAVEQRFFGAHDVSGEATGGSPTLEKSRVKEASSAAPTTAEHVEPLQEIDAGKNDDFLEPQVVSTPVYSKEAFLTQPMKSAAPSREPAQSAHRNEVGNLPRSSEEPSAAVSVAKFKEHAQEDAADKSGTTIAAAESPSPPTFEATQKDFTNELLAAAPNAKLAQELATQGVVTIALASSEPPVTSKSTEEKSLAVPSANSEEPAREDTGDNSVTMTAAGESPKAFAFQDPHEAFVKESSAGKPGAAPAHEPSSREDSSTASEMTLVSPESPVASKSVEEPSSAVPSVDSEEPAREAEVEKRVTGTAAADSPLRTSHEGPDEHFEKESLAVAPIGEPSSQEDSDATSDKALASSEPQVASKSVEEPSSAVPSVDSEEPGREAEVEESVPATAAAESPWRTSHEGPEEDFEEESLTGAPSARPIGEPSSQEASGAISDKGHASSEPQVASKFLKEPSSAVPSADSEEPGCEAEVKESVPATAAADSPLPTSHEGPAEDFEEESFAGKPGAGPAHEPSSREDSSTASDMALVSLESPVASKSVEEPSSAVPSVDSEEPGREAEVEKSVPATAAADSPLRTSHEGPEEDFEKESLAVAPIGESSSQADSDATSDKALASSEPQVASKSVEEPSSAVPSADSEEPGCEAEVKESVSATAAADSPLPTSHEGPAEDFEEESFAGKPGAAPAHEPSSREDSSTASDMALVSPESPVASKSVEEPSSAVPSVDSEEPGREAEVEKRVTGTAAADSPLRTSHEGPDEHFEKESLAVAPIGESSSQADSDATSDKALASSEPQVASKSVEEPSSAVPSVDSEEPGREAEVEESVPATAAAESPLRTSHEGPEEDFEEESLTGAPSARPIGESSSQEASGATGAKAHASAEPQVASKFVEEPSSAVPSADSEEPGCEAEVKERVTGTAAADSPLRTSHEGPDEHFEKESLAVAPIGESSSQEDSDATSAKALASSEPQVASKSVEEPSSAVPSVDSEEPGREAEVEESVPATAAAESPLRTSHEGPEEDFEKESFAGKPGAGPAHEPSSREDSSTASEMALVSPESPVASKSVEEPSSAVPSVDSEEPAREAEVEESVPATAAADSPLRTSHEGPEEDFVEESLAGKPGAGPAHEPSSREDLSTASDMTLVSSEPQVASKSVEKPSAAASGSSSEELAQEDAVGKSGNSIAAAELPLASSLEEPQEESVEEFRATAPSAESAEVLATQEDNDIQVTASESQTTSSLEESEGFEKESMASAPSGELAQEHSDMTVASPETKGASDFVNETSAAAPSAKFGECKHKADADESDTVIAVAESSLASSFDDPQEDFEKESSAAPPSAEPAQELATQEDISMALEAPETIMKSKFVEEPSSTLPSADSEESAREAKVDKSVPVPAAADSPLRTSHEGPEEDFEKESLAVAPIGEPSSQADSDATSDKALASSEPQVASKFVEEPSSAVSSVDSEDPGREAEVEKSVPATAATDSLLPTSHEGPEEDFEKESLAGKPGAGPAHEPSSREDSITASEMALVPRESPVASKFEEEPSSAVPSVDSEEPAREAEVEKRVTGTAAADSPLRTSHDGPDEHFEKESLAGAPSARPIDEPSSQEASGATSDKGHASSEPQVASKFVEEPSSAVPSSDSEEPGREAEVEESVPATAAADSPLPTSHEGPEEDFEKESLAVAVIGEPSSQADSDATSDKALASSEPQVASKFVEEPSSAVPSADSEEPGREAEVGKSVPVPAAAESPLPTSHEGPEEDFEKESLAVAVIGEPSSQADSDATSDKALASSEPQVASKFVEEPSSAVPSADSEEPGREAEVGKSVPVPAAAESPLRTSHEGPEEDFERESLADAPSARPIGESSSQEASGATGAKAHASAEPEVASKFVEEPSSAVPSADSVEPAREAEFEMSVPATAATDSLLPTSHEGPEEDLEKESLAGKPGAGPAHEPSSREDSITASEMALVSRESPVASKFEEEPSSAVPSASSEESAQEDGAVKSAFKSAFRMVWRVTGTAAADSPLRTSHEGPDEHFEKESLAGKPSARPIGEPSSQEASGATSDKGHASSEPQVASKFLEEPSSAVPSSDPEEPAREAEVDKSVPATAAADSPLRTSHEGPEEDFEKESLAVAPIGESSSQADSDATSDKALASSEPQVASKFLEEPSSAVPSADPEEPAREAEVDKSVPATAAADSPLRTSHEGPVEDFEKESLAGAPSAQPIGEPSSQEASGATGAKAHASAEPQVASKFVEEPSSAVPSSDSEEPAREAEVDKSVPATAAAESPLRTSHEGPEEDFEKESFAGKPGAGPAHEPSSREDLSTASEMTLVSPESPVASKSVEEPSSAVPSVDSEEPAREAEVEESVPATAAADSPLRTSHEGPDEHFEKESLAGAPSARPIGEPSSQEASGATSDKGHASSEPQVASKFVEEPLSAVPSAGSEEPEEPGREAEVGKSVPVPAAADSPLRTSHEGPDEHFEKESLAGAPSARPIDEPSSQEASGATDAKAHASAEPQVASKVVEEPSSAVPSADSEESAQEDGAVKSAFKSALRMVWRVPVPAAADSPLRTSHEGPEEDFEKESLAGAPSARPIGEPSSQDASDSTSDKGHASSEPQVASKSVEEPSSAVPSSDSEEPAREAEVDKSVPATAAVDSPLRTSHEGPEEDFEKESLAGAPIARPIGEPSSQDASDSTSDKGHASSEPQVASKSVEEPSSAVPSSDSEEPAREAEVEESVPVPAAADSPLRTSHEGPQEDFDKKSTAAVSGTEPAQELAAHEETDMAPASSKPNVASVDQKSLEVVKFIAESIEEAVSRTQSDLTDVKLKAKAAEDATKLQSQGSFLALGTTSVDSKEALMKESSPSTKLLEILEEENKSGKRGPVLVVSPVTSIVEEPQKPLAEEPLASAKSVPKGDARRGFARSSSEPQFAYKLEEHRKALAKESSVAAVPSDSTLGEEHAQEDFGDAQCLPFRIIGEGKHPRKESEFKLAEDVKSPATKSETASSPYVLEPKPSKIKEKKKKKERKPDATVEEKERRLSLGMVEVERKISLRADEKSSKYSPRAEEKHRHHFRHLRDRLRRAFSVNKET